MSEHWASPPKVFKLVPGGMPSGLPPPWPRGRRSGVFDQHVYGGSHRRATNHALTSRVGQSVGRPEPVGVEFRNAEGYRFTGHHLLPFPAMGRAHRWTQTVIACVHSWTREGRRPSRGCFRPPDPESAAASWGPDPECVCPSCPASASQSHRRSPFSAGR